MTELDILEKKIELTELGKTIPLNLLLTHSSPYIITFVLAIKNIESEYNSVTGKFLYEKYFTDSKGNLGYFEHIIQVGIDCDLFVLSSLNTD